MLSQAFRKRCGNLFLPPLYCCIRVFSSVCVCVLLGHFIADNWFTLSKISDYNSLYCVNRKRCWKKKKNMSMRLLKLIPCI
ncbi:hypothetical protein MIMGU_mgv1a017346mg [Erythranthe guttata]|uniref:Uncharacterized protein n=1 Tax=Erythranthe guttata TaxID=4155 RepID=A0A022RZM6_ERYGU|nr:hypothetical protein MIMGU_mgv1a017346mg [Erythranthe guttata]